MPFSLLCIMLYYLLVGAFPVVLFPSNLVLSILLTVATAAPATIVSALHFTLTLDLFLLLVPLPLSLKDFKTYFSSFWFYLVSIFRIPLFKY